MKKFIVILIGSLFLLAGCCDGHKGKQKQRRRPKVTTVDKAVKVYESSRGLNVYEICIRGYYIIYNYEGEMIQLKNSENKPIRCMGE